MKRDQFNSLAVIYLSVITSLILVRVDPIAARVVIDPGVDEAGNGLYGGMVQGRQITALITVTRTLSAATTSTLFTTSLCVKLSTSGSLTPTQCRSRRNWNGRRQEEPLLYVLFDQNGEDVEFVQPSRIHPSKVLSVETTELAKFRDGIPSASTGPVSIESSLETKDSSSTGSNNGVRVAQPIYFNALASILSNIFPGAVQSTTTSTRTSTVYVGGTTVVTVYTSTNSFTLVGSCYPAFPPLCSQ